MESFHAILKTYWKQPQKGFIKNHLFGQFIRFSLKPSNNLGYSVAATSMLKSDIGDNFEIMVADLRVTNINVAGNLKSFSKFEVQAI